MAHIMSGPSTSPLQAHRQPVRTAAALRPARCAPQLRKPLQLTRAAASETITKLSIPSDELLQTVLLEQNGSNGRITVKEVVDGSQASQGGLKAGQILKAVSDPAAPGNFWPVETRSNLRHILDQFRMQQAAEVGLEFWPEGSANAPMDRLGADQEERFSSPNKDMTQRRKEQREAYLSKEGTTNTTNWAAIAGGVFILPTLLILGYALGSGYIDSLGGEWRIGQ